MEPVLEPAAGRMSRLRNTAEKIIFKKNPDLNTLFSFGAGGSPTRGEVAMRLLLGQQPSRYSDPPPPPHNSSPVNWPHSSPRQGEGDGPKQCDEGTRLPDMVPEGGGD